MSFLRYLASKPGRLSALALVALLCLPVQASYAQLNAIFSPFRTPIFETSTSTLHIPVLEVNGSKVWVNLRVDSDGLLSVIGSGASTTSSSVNPVFDPTSNRISIPLAAMYTKGVRQTGAGTFRLELDLLSSGAQTRLGIARVKQEVSGNQKVSISTYGEQADETLHEAPSISADGRYIAFQSNATTLVPNDRNFDTDVFFVTLQVKKIARLVSVASGGIRTRYPKYSPAISANGRFVSFASDSEDLVKFDTNEQEDIFVHDLQTGVTERVSVSSTGAQGVDDGELAQLRSNGISAMSADGRYVVFESGANNLVANDTNTYLDIFVHDRQTKKATQVSITSTGGQSKGLDKLAPSISADGRYVVYESMAEDIYPGAKWGSNIFLHDLQDRSTKWVSSSRTGTYANSHSGAPRISADGRYVAFESQASDLVTGDTNRRTDIFVHDTLLRSTRRVSNGIDGEANKGSAALVLSADDRYIAFENDDTNLVDGDINSAKDVFVRLSG